MKRPTLRSGLRGAAWTGALIACLATLGCAGPGSLGAPPNGAGIVRAPNGQPVAPQAAMDAVVIGTSTRSDVSAALGKSISVPFDSGHEVWIYRWPGADRTTRSATELVILFAPSGVVTKARLRPGYATRS